MYLDWFACVLFFWAYIDNNDKNRDRIKMKYAKR